MPIRKGHTNNPAGRTPQWTDPEAVRKRVGEYFTFLRARRTGNTKLMKSISPEALELLQDLLGDRPTVCGLALALNMSRQNICRLRHEDSPVADEIRRGRQIIEACLEEGLYDGSAGGIKFNLINNYAWREIIESNVNQTTRVTADLSDDELARIAKGGS